MNILANKLLTKIRTFLREIRKVARSLLDFHRLKQTVFLEKEVSGLKLHIGPGPINIQGWINIDARGFNHIHLVTDDLELKEFNDNSVAEIYLCHVLEHLSFAEAQRVMDIFFKKLKKGGVLRISVPNFESMIDIYLRNLNDLEAIKFALMGGQDHPYNFHKSVFDDRSMRKMFERSGFQVIGEWSTIEDFGVDLGDWSSVTFAAPGKCIPISLNLKAIK